MKYILYIYICFIQVYIYILLLINVFCTLFLIYKEDRHVALTAQSTVNATWRVYPNYKFVMEDVAEVSDDLSDNIRSIRKDQTRRQRFFGSAATRRRASVLLRNQATCLTKDDTVCVSATYLYIYIYLHIYIHISIYYVFIYNGDIIYIYPHSEQITLGTFFLLVPPHFGLNETTSSHEIVTNTPICII